MLARSLDGFENKARSCVTERRKNPAGMQPTHADFAENMVPVKIAWLELARGGVATIGNSHSAAHAKSALGEIQAVANCPSDTVERNPFDKFGIYSALKDEIFEEPAHIVISECGANCRFESKTPTQSARHIIFAATLPDFKFPSCANASLARIQPQHDFAKRNQMIFAGPGVFDVENGHIGQLLPSRLICGKERFADKRLPIRRANSTRMRDISKASLGGKGYRKVSSTPCLLSRANKVAVFIHRGAHVPCAIGNLDVVRPRQNLQSHCVVQSEGR